MMLEKCFREYVSNFRIALLFGLLLVFVPLLAYFSNIQLSFGTLSIEYAFAPAEFIAVEFAIIALMLAFFSFFVSLVVLAVRKDLSKIRVEFYLSEMLKKFSFKVFVFLFVYSLVLYFIGLLLVLSGASLLEVNAAIFVISIPFLFVPQAIVIDEVSVSQAVMESLHFSWKNFRSVLFVFCAGSVLVALVLLLSFAADIFAVRIMAGRYIAMVLTMVFVVPFMEIMKTYVYMLKFDLIKRSEMAGITRRVHEPKKSEPKKSKNK